MLTIDWLSYLNERVVVDLDREPKHPVLAVLVDALGTLTVILVNTGLARKSENSFPVPW